MEPFSYLWATDVQTAISRLAALPTSAYIAGGTTLLDLMKDNVRKPDLLVDITGLSLRGISVIDSSVRSGR
jgi:xanthine dehydrogenase YagS FAD-binding subunit